VARALVFAVVVATGCGGQAPDLIGLEDQTAVVGQELVVKLNGTDPDGDRLKYTYTADVALSGRANMTQTPDGNGLFRWTPIAADVGQHVFDFTVSDGHNDTTVSINIDVESTAAGVPQFIQPAGTGTVVNLASDPCITVDITVQDSDTPQVTITEEDPKVAGAMFSQTDGTTAQWKWCPTQQQILDSDRYTLSLSADDGTHTKVSKNYVLVLGGSTTGLVINEIDYDNTGTDSFEYVEIYNPSPNNISLVGLWLVLVDGAANSEYDAVYLGEYDSLPSGQFLVIGGSGVDVPTGTMKIDPGWTTDAIQNGPDGVALIDDVTTTLLDALSYEGSLTSVHIIGFPSNVSLVEGSPTSATDSNTVILTLCRIPNGSDSNNASTDWATCTQRTKGTANVQ